MSFNKYLPVGISPTRSLLRRLLGGRIYRQVVAAMAAEIVARGRRGEFDAVILYNQDIWHVLSIAHACRRAGVSFISHYAEMHIAADYPNGWSSTYLLWERAHLHLTPWLSDGGIVISRFLADWTKKRSRDEPLLIPTLGEIPLASGQDDSRKPTLLTVSAGMRRDCLDLMIEGMRLLKERGGNTRLIVIGLEAKTKLRLQEWVDALGLSSNVELMGYVTEEELAAAYGAATSMVLLRAADTSSKACFPSRLYEYFGRGIPVVLTDTGDFPLYFRDGESALFVKPERADSFAEKILWLEQNPVEGRNIGRRGNAVARMAFDPIVNGQTLNKYLSGIVSRRRKTAGR